MNALNGALLTIVVLSLLWLIAFTFYESSSLTKRKKDVEVRALPPRISCGEDRRAGPQWISFAEGKDKFLYKDFYEPSEPLEPMDDDNPDGPLLIHTYMEGRLFSGYEAIFLGFLATQDLRRSRFIHWMDEPWVNATDAYKQYLVQKYRFIPSIEFRLADRDDLAQGTCFAEREEFMSRQSIFKFGLRDWSNVLRWLLLRKYGGVWIDSDSFPLLDFWGVHSKYFDSAFAGLNPDGRQFDAEKGHFNNNFLYASKMSVRKKLIEVACEFRRKPTGTVNKKGEMEYETIKPLIGEDKHPIRVFNNWIFNDGALRRCMMREDCPLVWIGLGETDPTWLRTNDLNFLCEKPRQTMFGYTAQFTLALELNAWQDATAYIQALDARKHVWVLHTRGKHCRSDVDAAGMYQWFLELARERIGENPFMAPEQPVELLTYDAKNVALPDHQVPIHSILIVVVSEADSSADRDVLRTIYSSAAWWPDGVVSSRAHTYKVLFIIPYDQKDDRINARLHAEANWFRDLILVDDHSFPSPERFLLSAAINRGLLKILNGYECRVFVLLFHDTIFLHIPNLFHLVNEASGNALFDKERDFASFSLTSRPDVKLSDWEDPYNDTFATLFTSSEGKRRSPHPFVIFSRDQLTSFLNMKASSNSTNEAQPDADEEDEEYWGRLQAPLTKINKKNIHAARYRLHRPPEPNTKVPLPNHHVEMSGSPLGVRSRVPDAWGHMAGSLRSFRGISAALTSRLSPSCAFHSSSHEDAAEQVSSVLLPVNMTIIWDVPCREAQLQLLAVAASQSFRISTWS